MTSERLFPIQPARWSVGTAGECQVIMRGIGWRNGTELALCCLFFDHHGGFLRQEIRPITYTFPPDEDRFWVRRSSEFRESVDKQLSEWEREIGLQEQTVWIKQFTAEEVGIELDPPEFQDPEFNDEEWNQEWMKAGNFIFYWNVDYLMDKDGNVTGYL